jgi:uncharacterized protein (DUF302 family)
VAAAKDEILRPYVLASENPGVVADVVAQTRAALTQSGFEVVGEYPVSAAAHVIVVTSDALRAAAAKTPDGGFGAALRVSVTQAGNATQVAYTNPAWMANIYRLGGEAEGVVAALEKALGRREEFGSKSGCTDKNLRPWHHMVFMPCFNDQVAIGSPGIADCEGVDLRARARDTGRSAPPAPRCSGRAGAGTRGAARARSR